VEPTEADERRQIVESDRLRELGVEQRAHLTDGCMFAAEPTFLRALTASRDEQAAELEHAVVAIQPIGVGGRRVQPD